MKDRVNLPWLVVLGVALALLVCLPSFAAKVPVSWQDPTENTDGTKLTDLKSIRLEWGTCNGAAFGTSQASILIPAGAMHGFVYPTGMTKCCIRAFAVNTAGALSDSSSVVSKDLVALGKPQILGQPVVLPPKH